jgi:hypothetical protein
MRQNMVWLVLVLLIAPAAFCTTMETINEYANVESPDGNYQFSYIKNGKSVIPCNQSYDCDDFDLHVYDKKHKTDSVLVKSLIWADGIYWTPDSKRLMIFQHTRYSSFVWLLNIKNKEEIYLDYSKYISDHSKNYDFKPSKGGRFSNVELIDWAADSKTADFSFSFGFDDDKQGGKFVFDFEKLQIIKLVQVQD